MGLIFSIKESDLNAIYIFIKKWVIQIFSLIYTFLFAWSVCMFIMLIFSSKNIYDLFSSFSHESQIIAISSKKGVYTVTLSNGKRVKLIPGTKGFAQGDHFEKIQNSFKFLVNGKNIANKKIIIQHCIGPVSIAVIWCVFSAMILFQTLYYTRYREAPVLSFAPLDKRRLPRKAKPTYDGQSLTPEQIAMDQKVLNVFFQINEISVLLVIPFLLIIYTIFYFLLDKWI